MPLLTLGISGGSTAAVMMIVLQFHGVPFGPALFSRQPEVAFGIIMGMIVAYVYMKIRPKVAAWQIKRYRSKKKSNGDEEELADAIDNIFKFQDKDRR